MSFSIFFKLSHLITFYSVLIPNNMLFSCQIDCFYQFLLVKIQILSMVLQFIDNKHNINKFD